MFRIAELAYILAAPLIGEQPDVHWPATMIFRSRFRKKHASVVGVRDLQGSHNRNSSRAAMVSSGCSSISQ
jgi:hypothetical protein